MKNLNNYQEKFYSLLESSMGDVKPLLSEQSIPTKFQLNKTYVGIRSTDGKEYRITIKQIVPNGKDYMVTIQGPGTYEGKNLDGKSGLYNLSPLSKSGSTPTPNSLSMSTSMLKQRDKASLG